MKIFVGVSGGVDSSVSAALLKEAGHDVVGVFLRVWQPDFLPCTWRDDRTDAKRVCATLGMPFLELDCQEEYKRSVADYMVAEYKAGRTPNPDVMCNEKIKFGIFYEKALELGADAIATGHYAQNVEDEQGFHLLQGKDIEKDQSYFLWKIKKEQLTHIFFPVGHMEKKEVRKEAARFGLHTSAKKDSQGLCFLGKLDMHDFLTHFIKQKQGDVLNEKGEVVGYHDGAVFLTLGQRHGFTITKKTPNDKRYFVIEKNVGDNTITVSDTPVRAVQAMQKDTEQNVMLSDTNWFEDVDVAKTYRARLRYRQKLFPVSVHKTNDDAAEIIFKEYQPFVPSGQSLVLYDGSTCVGGGVIES